MLWHHFAASGPETVVKVYRLMNFAQYLDLLDQNLVDLAIKVSSCITIRVSGGSAVKEALGNTSSTSMYQK